MTTNKRHYLLTIALLLAGGAGLGLGGCASNSKFGSDATAPVSTAVVAAGPSVGGAQAWADTCMRCHNLRSPSNYSADQWETITMHMRVRCSLTGEDARAITAFLKAGAGESSEGSKE